jgi:uncharacterized protein YuzE
MVKIEYKSDSKILSIRVKESKSVDSDIKGNVVLDYDEAGDLVNIDVMEVNIEELIKIPSTI